MSPVPDFLKRSTTKTSGHPLVQTDVKPSANEQREQNGQSPITSEPDPGMSREELVKEGEKQFKKQGMMLISGERA